MAEFDRKTLRKIFEDAEIDVPKDVLGQICNLHTTSNEELTEAVKTLKADLEKAERERDDFKAKAPKDGVETVTKEEYDTLKREYSDFKTSIEAEKAHNAKETAYRDLLKAAGVADKRISAVLKVTDIDGIELDKDGKIKDAEKRADSIKAEWADFIETTSEKGASTANPPKNDGGAKLTKADIYKKDNNGRYVLSTTERQKALVENKIQ